MCSWPCLLPILQTYKLQPITLVTITNGAATQAAAWQKQAQTVNNTVVPTQFQMDTGLLKLHSTSSKRSPESKVSDLTCLTCSC